MVPNVEEFGITAVEAQAAGRPVVAAAAGGALETVVDGGTGVLVPPGDLDALTAVLSDEGLGRLDPLAAYANDSDFGRDVQVEAARACRGVGAGETRASADLATTPAGRSRPQADRLRSDNAFGQ